MQINLAAHLHFMVPRGLNSRKKETKNGQLVKTDIRTWPEIRKNSGRNLA